MKKVGIGVIALLLVIALGGCGKQKMDITQFIDVRFSGIDGKAAATVKFDFPALEEVLTFGKDDITPAEAAAIIALEASMECEADISEGLSNGDSIKISIFWDKEAAKKCGVVFTGNEMTIEVTGLKEAEEIDIFADMEITYSGIAPEGTVKIEAEDFNVIRFIVTPDSHLRNGDTITVTAEADWEKFEEKGYIVTNREKTFTVEGLDAYIWEYSQFGEDILTEMDSAARELISERLSEDYTYKTLMHPNEWLIGETLIVNEISGVEQELSWLLCMKDEAYDGWNWGAAKNQIYILYAVTAKDNLNPDGKTTYFAVYFSDMIMRNTGEIEVNISEPKIYASYDSVEDAYADIVTYNSNNYNCEENK